MLIADADREEAVAKKNAAAAISAPLCGSASPRASAMPTSDPRGVNSALT